MRLLRKGLYTFSNEISSPRGHSFMSRRANVSNRFERALAHKYGDDWSIFWNVRDYCEAKVKGENPNVNFASFARQSVSYIKCLSYEWISLYQINSSYIQSDISVRVISNLSPLAFCESSNGGCRVSISIGLYYAIMNIVFLSLTDTDFLDIKGDSKLVFFPDHEREKLFLDRLFCEFKDYGPNVSDVSIKPVQIDDIFANVPFQYNDIILACVITNMVLGWILAHEVAHCLRGHLDVVSHFSSRDVDINGIGDIGFTGRRNIPDYINKYLELDADHYATHLFFRVANQRAWFSILPDDIRDNPSWRGRYIGAFATVAVTLIDRARYWDGQSTCYPNCRERLMTVTKALQMAWLDSHSQSGSSLDSVLPSLFSISGALADAAVAHELIANSQKNLDVNPLFFQARYAYGALAGVAVLDSVNLIDIAKGTDFFHFHRDRLGISEHFQNRGINFPALPREETAENYPLQFMVIAMIARHFGCTESQLRDAWLDAVMTLQQCNSIIETEGMFEIEEY